MPWVVLCCAEVVSGNLGYSKECAQAGVHTTSVQNVSVTYSTHNASSLAKPFVRGIHRNMLKGDWEMRGGPARRHGKERCAPENFSGEVNHGFSPDFVGTDSTAC
jgi:hypothetical protein